VQIYLYIVLAIAVYVISVIKTYGLGYSRGYDSAYNWIYRHCDATKIDRWCSEYEEYHDPRGNSQEKGKDYLEDTSRKNPDGGWHRR
jgi:hypothetical protein